MPITVESLRNLAGNQSVMLDAQADGLQRTNFSQRFRSAFGTSGAKAANARTLEAIRQAVVSDPRYTCVRQRADALFARIDGNKLIQSNAIRSLVADLDAARELHVVALRADALARLQSPEGNLPAAGRAHPEAVAHMVEHLLAAYGEEAGGDLSDLTAQGLAARAADVFSAIEEASGGDAAAADWAARNLEERPAAFATPGGVRRALAGYRAAADRLDTAAARLGAQTFANLPAGDGLREARVVGSALLKALAPVAEAMAAADDPLNVSALGDPAEGRAFIARALCAALPADVRRTVFDALHSEGGLQLARFCQEAADPRCAALLAGATALAAELRAQLGGDAPDFSEAVATTYLDAMRVPTEAFALAPLKSLFMGAPSPEIAKIRDAVCAHPAAQGGEAAFAERLRANAEGNLRDIYNRERAKMGDHPNGNPIVFDKDIVRTLNVTLPNGERLANSVDEAKNQIARYVAHDAEATFAALAPALKARAEQIIALCSQETEKAVSYCVADVCKDEKGIPAFMVGEDGDRNSTFTLHENPDGSLGFVYEATVPMARVIDRSGTARPCGPGSAQRAQLAFSVAADGTLAVQTAALGIYVVPEAEQEAQNVQKFGRLVETLGFTGDEGDRLVALMERETAAGADLAVFNDALQDSSSPLRRLFTYPALQRDPATFAKARTLLRRFDAAYAQLSADNARDFPPESKWFLERLVFDDLALKLEAGRALPKPDAFVRSLAADRNPFVGFMTAAKRHASVGLTVVGMPPQDREGVVRALALTAGSEGPSVLNRLVAHREELRALVARGKVTRENVFKACWGNPIPESLRTAMNVQGEQARERAVSSALEYFDTDRLAAIGVTAADPRFLACLTTMWKFGVDAQTALDIAEGRAPEPAQVINPFEPATVIPVQEASRPQKAEVQLAIDLHRMRDGFVDNATRQSALVGAPSTFSIVQPNGTVLDLDSSANGLDEANTQLWGEGKSYHTSQRIRSAITALCGEVHPQQAVNVILCLAQGGISPLQALAGAHGFRATEHSQAHFQVEAVRDARGLPTGDVAVRISNLPGCPLVFDWTVVVHPDGSQESGPVTMRRADAAPAA